MYIMLFYVIYDIRVNSFLIDKKGNLLLFSTIRGCIDYLLYVLNVEYDDFDYYSFVLRQRKL